METPQLDPRIVRVGIEINGQLKTYDDLFVTANGAKFANALQNECEIRVANLSKPDRDYLLTETSPFNKNRTPKRIVVSAGRRSMGVSQVFIGDITSVVPSQPPDVILTFKAKTGQFQKGNVIASAQPAQTPLSRIAAQVAKDLSLTLIFEAVDKAISNYSFTGAALKQVEKLGQVGGVNAYVDDQELIVKDYNKPLLQRTSVLSAESGMIGIPEPTEQGVKVRFLFAPDVKLGGRLTINSKINPGMNGDFTIFKLNYELSNRDEPFYYIAECKREGK